MLQVGDTAPDFELPGSDGVDIDRYSLDKVTDSGAVVLLFYPFDFSPVCTEELCDFRDSEWLTMTDDLDVFGVSTDTAFAHKTLIQQNDLPFPLLSDNDGSVSEQYDVLYDELVGHSRVSKRAVFLIDAKRTIRYSWVADEWIDDPNIGDVNEAAQQLDGIGLSR
jgi:peroxiredoxin